MVGLFPEHQVRGRDYGQEKTKRGVISEAIGEFIKVKGGNRREGVRL